MKSWFASALILGLAVPAAAEESRDLRVRIGLGGQVQPAFLGGKTEAFSPLFDFDMARGDAPFRIEAPDDSFGLRLVRGDNFAFGPAVNIESRRSEADVGAPVGRVATTIEAGAFAEAMLGESVRLRGELRRGLNGHEGLVGFVGADAIFRDGDRYAVTLGPRLLLSDARYQRAYFGVEPGSPSGLAEYRPGGGVHGVALAAGATTQCGPRWGLFGYARAERLVGDAGRSPIVRTFGSQSQLSAGLGLSYQFRIRRPARGR